MPRPAPTITLTSASSADLQMPCITHDQAARQLGLATGILLAAQRRRAEREMAAEREQPSHPLEIDPMHELDPLHELDLAQEIQRPSPKVLA